MLSFILRAVIQRLLRITAWYCAILMRPSIPKWTKIWYSCHGGMESFRAARTGARPWRRIILGQRIGFVWVAVKCTGAFAHSVASIWMVCDCVDTIRRLMGQVLLMSSYMKVVHRSTRVTRFVTTTNQKRTCRSPIRTCSSKIPVARNGWATVDVSLRTGGGRMKRNHSR